MSSLTLLALSLSALAQTADEAATWSPLRVYVECQSQSRVEVCTYLRGILDGSAVLTAVPRSDDQVTVFVNVTSQALDDRVNLRFTSDLPGTPPAYELTTPIDSRASADDQLAQVERVFSRGVAVYLSQVNPEAVSVSLAAPASGIEQALETRPWGISVYGGGWGNWSDNYQSADLWGGGSGSWTEESLRVRGGVGANWSYGRQPSLEVDGASVDLVTSSYSVQGSMLAARLLDERWSVGALARGGHQDPEGQFLSTARLHAGISRDWFPSSDPRGNQLAIAWLIGGQADRYNQLNELVQEEAIFATHMLLALGEVRFDTVELNVRLSAQAQLLAPMDRNILSGSGGASINLGDHVDLNFNAGVTRQAIPGPLDIDTSNYEEVTRTNYAEPLQMYGSLNLRVHWDPTNGVQNNRFGVADYLGSLSNL